MVLGITEHQMNLSSSVPNTRKLSPFWATCERATSGESVHGSDQGFFLFDDFTAFPLVATNTAQLAMGNYKIFTSDGGNILDAGESVTEASGTANWDIQGVLSLYSDGDNEGANLTDAVKSVYINATTAKKAWFEARVKTSTIADTKHGMFIGLSANAAACSAVVPIAADGTMEAAGDFVGFWRREGDGDYFDFVHQQGGVAIVAAKADAAVIVADTWIKLGIYYDGTKLRWYVNGAEVAATTEVSNTVIAASGFPDDIALGRQIAVLNATATTPGTSEIDWWAVAQEA